MKLSKKTRKKQIKHKHLKAIAKQFLKDLGFSNKEIQEEYFVEVEGIRQKIRVDVVGIDHERKIAIECGRVPAEKIGWLNLFFDEVIVLPYMNDRVTHGSSEDALKHRISEIGKRLEHKSQQVKDLQRKLSLKNVELEEDRRFFGKAVILGLYKIGCLPRGILHSGAFDVIEKFEDELENRTAIQGKGFVMDWGERDGVSGLKRIKQ